MNLGMIAAAVLTAYLAVASPAAFERPRDIWVFRSVLDKRARMVTVALNEEMWAAYDATNCGPYKVWKGGVKFDGAVYTTQHGPQPTSQGTPYDQYELDKPVWFVRRIGSDQKVEPRFRGYRFMPNGQVRFQYEIELDNNQTIQVFETPEYYADGDDVVFSRSFETRNVPNGLRVGLFLEHISTQDRSSANGMQLSSYGLRDRRISRAELKSNGTSEWRITYPAQNFDDSEAIEANVNPEPAPTPAPVAQDAQVREPGLAMRIYWFNKDISRLPLLVEGQTANINKVVPNINFRSDADFGVTEFEDHYLAHITGYLNITQAGEYKFRLDSDDGSRFSIRDEIIVDNDGLHGRGSPIEGAFNLATGEHPILVEFFDNAVDGYLTLEWMRPGSSSWEIIPASAFTTISEVHVTAPGEKAILDPDALQRPGDKRPLQDVHPSYDLITVRPENFKPRVGGIDFLPGGQMVICNWEPDGGVYVIDGVLGQARNPKVTRIAAGLAEPLGIQVVDGDIYVLQKQELTKLVDHNRDGVIDEYYAVANGWGVTDNFHEFAFGLVYKDGYFYATLATAIDPGGSSTKVQNQDRGKVVKIDRNGNFTLPASGLRTPNGIGIGVDGEIFIADNQGDWLPSSKILHYTEGAFFGSRSVDFQGTANLKEKPPVVWLPQGEIGNSPSQPGMIMDGPYKGQMIHSEVTHGGVKRVFVEKVNGEYQGCVFRFTQGMEAGINRICWGPDGALYVGGIGSTGNWGQEGKERFGLQKITYNGKPTFEMLAIRAMRNGMEIELTEPLAASHGNTPSDYEVRHWQYVPTAQYGGPKVNPKKLDIKSVTVSADRKKVFLEVDELTPGYVVYVHMSPDVRNVDGDALWATEGWYTLNSIPNRRGQVNPAPMAQVNTLTAEERQQGFELLFDGSSMAKWEKWNGGAPGEGWKVQDGMIVGAGGQGGDLSTKENFADFELKLEWKAELGANSGIIYRAKTGGTSWHTGPEYQILDVPPLTQNKPRPVNTTASFYDVYAPSMDVLRPAGEWNESRIVAKGKHIEHWLNGFKVVDIVVDSPDYMEKIAKSKFANMAGFAREATGRIVLQDHGNVVSFRNIKIRKL